jgi:carboxylesterase
MTPRAGAEPWSHQGGPTGVLLCHGFTGSPASLRSWADHLAGTGLTVELPLLPGHGTRWQDMQVTGWPDWYSTVERSLTDLTQRCDAVFVMGLSMGGTLALRLAEQHPDAVSGLVLVNPSVHTKNPLVRLVPLLRHVVAATPGLSNDIKRPGQDEVAYDRVPLNALHSLGELWRLTSQDLSLVRAPLQIYVSVEDHVVERSNTKAVSEGVSSAVVEVVELPDSFHVATMDNDADTIMTGSVSFIEAVLAGDGPSEARTTIGNP